MKKLLPLLLISAAAMAAGASATAQTTDFPEGAQPLTPEALREALTGKVFSITPAKGSTWRWEFKGNGYFFLNAGSFSDSGKWSTKESSVCQDTGKNMGCNEMRQKDGTLYLKRDSGEIVTFKPQ
ncbi:hypothetical protein GmRootA79_41850 [Acidovorax sp. A79]|uniref:hypothetical protein n=1 Tax=Acidovorax sp. A79 TaxID=3056107 RepID=UPI0034E894BF